MQTYNKRRKHRSLASRKGTAVVESAVLMPLLIFISLGAIDVSQYINLAQVVSNASREGGRIASRDTTESVTDVDQAVRAYLRETYSQLSDQAIAETLSITVYDGHDCQIQGTELKEIESGDPLSVKVEFNFDTIRWLPGMDYFSGGINRRETHCRRE